MSYYAYDDKGYVGDVASIGGWEDLVRAVSGRNPVIDTFVAQGTTETVAALRAALDALRLAPQSVEDTRANLVHLVTLAEGSFTVGEG